MSFKKLLDAFISNEENANDVRIEYEGKTFAILQRVISHHTHYAYITKKTSKISWDYVSCKRDEDSIILETKNDDEILYLNETLLVSEKSNNIIVKRTTTNKKIFEIEASIESVIGNFVNVKQGTKRTLYKCTQNTCFVAEGVTEMSLEGKSIQATYLDKTEGCKNLSIKLAPGESPAVLP